MSPTYFYNISKSFNVHPASEKDMLLTINLLLVLGCVAGRVWLGGIFVAKLTCRYAIKQSTLDLVNCKLRLLNVITCVWKNTSTDIDSLGSSTVMPSGLYADSGSTTDCSFALNERTNIVFNILLTALSYGSPEPPHKEKKYESRSYDMKVEGTIYIYRSFDFRASVLSIFVAGKKNRLSLQRVVVYRF